MKDARDLHYSSDVAEEIGAASTCCRRSECWSPTEDDRCTCSRSLGVCLAFRSRNRAVIGKAVLLPMSICGGDSDIDASKEGLAAVARPGRFGAASSGVVEDDAAICGKGPFQSDVEGFA